MSNSIKDTAVTKSINDGKTLADKYLNEAVKVFEKDPGVMSNISSPFYREYHDNVQYRDKTKSNTVKRTEQVRKSTIEAIKYLRNPASKNVDGRLIDWY